GLREDDFAAECLPVRRSLEVDVALCIGACPRHAESRTIAAQCRPADGRFGQDGLEVDLGGAWNSRKALAIELIGPQPIVFCPKVTPRSAWPAPGRGRAVNVVGVVGWRGSLGIRSSRGLEALHDLRVAGRIEMPELCAVHEVQAALLTASDQ